MQKGNETESDAEADRMQQYLVVGKIMSEQVFQQVGNRRFADPAEAERGQRDAKASSSSFVRRILTMANSETTKKALANTSSKTRARLKTYTYTGLMID